MFDLNKNNWPEYQFSEIAEQISERIDPAESNAGVYVGLEHIEPNSIHIKEHGKPSDVKGIKLKVYKGDIIFGKRRAYQRKAAIANFDGICSAHAMVLRAKPKVMIPQLFPFFLHSDAFMNRAIDISEGSLSPTIKWKILAKQKFSIPPLDEQKKFADLLWAGDELLQKYSFLKYKLNILYESSVQALNKGTNSLELTSCKLGDVLNINPENISSKTDGETEIIYIDISSISYKNILKNEIKKFLFKDAPSRAKRRVKEDDVIVSLVRPYQQQIVTAKNIKENTLSSTGTAILRSNDKPLLNLIYHQLFSRNFIYFCERIMTGTNYPAITADDLAKFKVFSYDDQKKNKLMSDKFSAIENEIIALSKNIAITKTLNDSLRNKFFS